MVEIALKKNSTSQTAHNERELEEKFGYLFPDYDYSINSAFHEKDVRKRKRMKTMY